MRAKIRYNNFELRWGYFSQSWLWLINRKIWFLFLVVFHKSEVSNVEPAAKKTNPLEAKKFLLPYTALRLSLVEGICVHPVVTEKNAFKKQLKQFWITFWIFLTIMTLMDPSKDLIFLPCSLSQIWGFQCRTCCKKTNPLEAKKFDYENWIESTRNAFTGCFALLQFQCRDRKI